VLPHRLPGDVGAAPAKERGVTQELIRYDAMCSAIEAAYAVDEVKDIRDKALALEIYARQALNVEAERQACEIRLRAERKAGQLLAKTIKKGGDKKSKSADTTSILEPLGISKDQSSKWQKLAAVPDDEFDAVLADRAAKPITSPEPFSPLGPRGMS
jgi:hypothetical protein